MPHHVKLEELLSACADLANRSEAVIRKIVIGGDLGVVDKAAPGEDFDPQTAADLAAQRLIVGGLKSLYPDLPIIGEEGDLGPPEDSAEKVDAAEIDTGIVATYLSGGGDGPKPEPLPERLAGEIDPSRLVVWVDPLDGTAEFAAGRLEAVTTLVGIALDGEPVAGVVHVPFDTKEEGKIIYGVHYGGHGVASGFIAGCEPKRRPLQDDSLVAVTSRSHMSDALKALVTKLAPSEEVRVGGAGNKVLRVLLGEADVYFYPRPGTKRWDTCAPEALIRAAGGQLVDQNGNKYNYSADIEDPVNSNGILVAIHQEHIDRMVSVTRTDDITRDIDGHTIDTAWLRNVFGKHGHPDAGRLLSVVGDPLSAIRGQHSHTVRLALRWSGDFDASRGDVSSVYLKRIVPADMAERSEAKWARDIASYRNEAAFYDTCASDKAVPAPMPLTVQSRDDPSGFLMVMRDLSSTHTQHEFLDARLARNAVDAIARQHAAYFGRTDLPGLWNPGSYWTKEKRPPGELETVPSAWDAFYGEIVKEPDVPADIAGGGDGADYANLGRGLLEVAPAVEAAYAECVKELPTLVHGDYKLANILFAKDTGEAVPIDFQWSGISTPASDIAYLMHSSLEDPADAEKVVVPFYLERLEAHGGPRIDSTTFARHLDTVTTCYAYVVIAYMWGRSNPAKIRANRGILGRCTHNRSMPHVYALIRTFASTLNRVRAALPK